MWGEDGDDSSAGRLSLGDIHGSRNAPSQRMAVLRRTESSSPFLMKAASAALRRRQSEAASAVATVGTEQNQGRFAPAPAYLRHSSSCDSKADKIAKRQTNSRLAKAKLMQRMHDRRLQTFDQPSSQQPFWAASDKPKAQPVAKANKPAKAKRPTLSIDVPGDHEGQANGESEPVEDLADSSFSNYEGLTITESISPQSTKHLIRFVASGGATPRAAAKVVLAIQEAKKEGRLTAAEAEQLEGMLDIGSAGGVEVMSRLEQVGFDHEAHGAQIVLTPATGKREVAARKFSVEIECLVQDADDATAASTSFTEMCRGVEDSAAMQELECKFMGQNLHTQECWKLMQDSTIKIKPEEEGEDGGRGKKWGLEAGGLHYTPYTIHCTHYILSSLQCRQSCKGGGGSFRSRRWCGCCRDTTCR
jgi:hypothetical protein